MRKLLPAAFASLLVSIGFNLPLSAAPANGGPAQAADASGASTDQKQAAPKKPARARRVAAKGRPRSEVTTTADLNRKSLQDSTKGGNSSAPSTP